MAKREIKVSVNYETIHVLYDYLINKYGDGDELYTFDVCENEGINLSGSTIDKIAFQNGGQNIMFYFDENVGYCDMLEEFKLKDLAKFYNELETALESGQYCCYDEFGNVGEGNCAQHDLMY